ncbi:MAG TPA: xanthine dehydrogenase family protein molybdopterin-binding subunit [Xanthobacteraceae bacterium]|nr:xanthine dehydrogenase family protein molybdopterin-binding subunit [Xanthobacteraceae bacterium]
MARPLTSMQSASSTSYIGVPVSRVDGRMKVTGTAKYAAEPRIAGLLHGFVIGSPIAKGRIRRIDVRDALAVEGVVDVFTHEHRPRLAAADDNYHDDVAPPGSPFRPLYDDEIRFSGQPVALVVAEEPEIARFAAAFVRIEYVQKEHVTDLSSQLADATPNKAHEIEPRGDAQAAFAQAPVRVECEYRMAIEHHNPMEMFGSTAIWEGDDRITVFDKTQGSVNNRNYLAGVLELPREKVRVISPFVGGAFGSGLRPQYQLPLAAMAARALKRPVRVALTRQQMFTLGYRPANVQKLALGAERDGGLVSFRHEAIGMTSRFEDFQRNLVDWSNQLYRCANSEVVQKLVKLDLNTPCDMRAPGGAEGMYAIECAVDELAHELGMDPLELRLENYSDVDQSSGKPYSSKELRECYRQGAERFGWSRRNSAPRSMREGNELVGFGLATGIWEAMRMEASARVVLGRNGDLEVASAFADIGPGTYTMMSQIAAEMLGVPIYNVVAKLGDSSLPPAPVEGGSWTTASLGCAVRDACLGVQRELFRLAQEMDGSPLADLGLRDVSFSDGQIRAHADPARAVSLADAMRSGDVERITQEATSKPDEEEKFASFAHTAVFAEVRIDEELGVVRVTRVVNAVAAGRIVNPKTAASQISGAVVGGIGMALQEETYVDHALGRPMNHNLAEYHVPVNADVHAIDVIFVEEKDEAVNPLGVKGLAEIGIVGTAAAIANAVFHATGRRVRELPITLDKVMGWAGDRSGA